MRTLLALVALFVVAGLYANITKPPPAPEPKTEMAAPAEDKREWMGELHRQCNETPIVQMTRQRLKNCETLDLSSAF